MSMPDKRGHFGVYGGKFAPETLMPALMELESAYLGARKDKEFQAELDFYFREFIGRPTPLYFAPIQSFLERFDMPSISSKLPSRRRPSASGLDASICSCTWSEAGSAEKPSLNSPPARSRKCCSSICGRHGIWRRRLSPGLLRVAGAGSS